MKQKQLIKRGLAAVLSATMAFSLAPNVGLLAPIVAQAAVSDENITNGKHHVYKNNVDTAGANGLESNITVTYGDILNVKVNPSTALEALNVDQGHTKGLGLFTEDGGNFTFIDGIAVTAEENEATTVYSLSYDTKEKLVDATGSAQNIYVCWTDTVDATGVTSRVNCETVYTGADDGNQDIKIQLTLNPIQLTAAAPSIKDAQPWNGDTSFDPACVTMGKVTGVLEEDAEYVNVKVKSVTADSANVGATKATVSYETIRTDKAKLEDVYLTNYYKAPVDSDPKIDLTIAKAPVAYAKANTTNSDPANYNVTPGASSAKSIATNAVTLAGGVKGGAFDTSKLQYAGTEITGFDGLVSAAVLSTGTGVITLSMTKPVESVGDVEGTITFKNVAFTTHESADLVVAVTLTSDDAQVKVNEDAEELVYTGEEIELANYSVKKGSTLNYAVVKGTLTGGDIPSSVNDFGTLKALTANDKATKGIIDINTVNPSESGVVGVLNGKNAGVYTIYYAIENTVKDPLTVTISKANLDSVNVIKTVKTNTVVAPFSVADYLPDNEAIAIANPVEGTCETAGWESKVGAPSLGTDGNISISQKAAVDADTTYEFAFANVQTTNYKIKSFTLSLAVSTKAVIDTNFSLNGPYTYNGTNINTNDDVKTEIESADGDNGKILLNGNKTTFSSFESAGYVFGTTYKYTQDEEQATVKAAGKYTVLIPLKNNTDAPAIINNKLVAAGESIDVEATLEVQKKVLTVGALSIVGSKEYDGTVALSPNQVYTIALTGIVGKDDVDAEATVEYTDKAVGTNHFNIKDIKLVGKDAPNYTTDVEEKNNEDLSAADPSVAITKGTGSIEKISDVDLGFVAGKEVDLEDYAIVNGDNVTYTSADEKIATVDADGIMTMVKAGTTTIEVKVLASENYTAAAAPVTLNVTLTVPQSIADATIAAIADQEYTGEEIMPAVKVTLGDTELEEFVDYLVSYDNNIEVGTATVIVTGIEKYEDTKTATFNIVEKKSEGGEEGGQGGEGTPSEGDNTPSEGGETPSEGGNTPAPAPSTDTTTGSSTDVTPSSGGSGGSGGGGGSANTTTTTTKNADGSTTTKSVTKTATGTTTVTTTKKADGSETKTKVVENKDGSGSVTETTKTAKGTVKEVAVITDTTGAATEVTTSVTSASGASMKVSYTAKGSALTVSKIETTNKKAVTIPATVKVGGKTYKVTAVGKNALKGNKDVTTITFGKNIKTIGAKACYGATKAKTLTFKKAPTKVGTKAFTNINKNATIKITGTAKAYKKAVKLIKKAGAPKTVKFKRVK